MRRYGLLLLVTILAVTSLLAAAAYNEAVIDNVATIEISATDDSLLSLYAKPFSSPPSEFAGNKGNKDATARISGNRLVFDFSRGRSTAPGDANYGLQPGSVYAWEWLFLVHNKTSETVQTYIKHEISGLPAGVTIEMRGKNTVNDTGWKNTSTEQQMLLLQPRDPLDLDGMFVSVRITVDASVASLGIFTGKIVVRGVAQ